MARTWISCLLLMLLANTVNADPSQTIWFDQPAKKWDEALPVGNGRLGAMVFGSAIEERLQLNEDTYWSGGPYSTVVKGGHKVLPDIQRLVFDGKPLEAHNLFGRHLTGYPVEQQKYQSLANLYLHFDLPGQATDYRRSLDLSTGVVSVTYKVSGIRFEREVFASAPDNAIVVRVVADQPGALNFRVQLRGVRNQAHSNYGTDYFRMDPVGTGELAVSGRSADYLGITGQIRYEGRVRVLPTGGKLITRGTEVFVEGADAVTLVFVAATNFIDYRKVSGDPRAKVETTLASLHGKSFETLKRTAVADHRRYFDRVSLTLPTTFNSELPTDQRKAKYQAESDPSLAALAYNFGRYVLIASSRPGTQPANLQGIWNDDMNPMWDSKYTTNINTEMNYWAADSANLSELSDPLFKMIRELTDQGSKVAKEHYGAGGWVFHQNTDLWRVAAPMDGPNWGTFTTGGAWLCTHLWERYLHTQDLAFLRRAYPLIEGSVKFFADFLVPQKDGKYLVTNPSTSPENFPDGDGNKPFFDETTGAWLPGTTICAGSAIDMQIIHDLFGYFIAASKVLSMNSPLVERARSMQKRLLPPQIASDGTLREWADDWKSLEPQHRHVSQLYGLYPGRVLWDKRTPQLEAAYRATLEERGDGGAGWSIAWKMALWARLGEGDRANTLFKGYLANQSCAQLFALCSRAMQVDGTLGLTAAITEMLIQSHDGAIDVLPALPKDWPSGSFKGVCVRGGFVVDFAWTNGKISGALIRSRAGGVCRVRVGRTAKVTCEGREVESKPLPGGTLEFLTQLGKEYVLE